MINPELDRSLEETRELHQRWSQFREFCKMAMSGEHQITGQAELKFMELKSRIAMLHDGFMTKLTHEAKTGQNIMNIVKDCILLKRVANYSDAEKQKFEFDWNEGFILLTEQIGTLEEEQKRLAAIDERKWKADKRMELLKARINNIVKSGYFKMVTVVLALVVGLVVLPYIGVYNYDFFYKNSKTRTYFLKAANVYRQYINKNYEYKAIADISSAGAPSEKGVTAAEKGDLTWDYFIQQVPFEAGCAPTSDNALTIKNLLDPKLEFQSERYIANNVEVRFFYVLCKTSEDAERFVKLSKSDLSANANAAALAANAFLGRNCNLLVFGLGNSPYVTTHVAGKKLLTNEADLLQ